MKAKFNYKGKDYEINLDEVKTDTWKVTGPGGYADSFPAPGPDIQIADGVAQAIANIPP